MPLGRPPKYSDPEILQAKCDEYFMECLTGKEVNTVDKKGKPLQTTIYKPASIAGLAYHLGFASRQSIDDYLNQNQWESDEIKAKFTYVLTRAKLACELSMLEGASAGLFNDRIALAVLSKHGYSTKHDVNTTGRLTIQTVNYAPQDPQPDLPDEAA